MHGEELKVYLPLPAGRELQELVLYTERFSQIPDKFVFEVTVLPLIGPNFTGILLLLDRATATPNVPISVRFDISLLLSSPHRSKSPSLAFDPLINNSSPVLRAVTSRKELDTRGWGTRMLGLPMGFGTGQFLSCQNQYLDEKEGGSVKQGRSLSQGTTTTVTCTRTDRRARQKGTTG